MSSSPVPRSTRLVLALLAAGFVLHACGHKKAPVPPPRMIPQTVFQLRVHQRGNEAVLRFPYPITNYRGVTLSGISRVEIFQLEKVIPPEAIELYEQDLEDWKKEQAEYQAALAARGQAPIIEPAEPTGAPGEELVTDEEPSPVEPMEELAEPPTPAQDEDTEPDEVMDREPSAMPDVAAEGDTAEGDQAAEGEEGEGADEGEEAGQEPGEEEEETLRAPGQAPTPVDLILVDPRSYEHDAEIVATLEGAELEGAIQGAEVIVRIPLSPPATEGSVGYAFAVRTRSTEGLDSALSQISAQTKLLYQEPPAAPGSLDIEPQAQGIHLNWTSGKTPEEGFKVYRRDAQAREYTDSIGTTGPEILEYTDYSAVLGSRYIYAVTAVDRSQPLLESNLSVEREILYQDRFAPAAPTSVVGFPEEGQVRVLWDASTSDDVAGYIIFRRQEGGTAKALNKQPVDDLEYVDTDVEPGQVLIYSAIAVDGAGNRSDASAEVRVRVP